MTRPKSKSTRTVQREPLEDPGLFGAGAACSRAVDVGRIADRIAASDQRGWLRGGGRNPRLDPHDGAESGNGAAGPAPQAASVAAGTPTRTRLLVLHGEALFAHGLAALLAAQDGIEIAGELHDEAQIPDPLSRTACDILLIALPSYQATLRLVEAYAAGVAVVALARTDVTREDLALLRAGARAVVPIALRTEELVEALRAVAAGHVWLPPRLQEELLAGVSPRAESTPLSEREREVAHLAALGLHNAEIAAKLFVSESTVKSHLNNIFHKLDIRDRVELALYAARAGIVSIHEPGLPRQKDTTRS